MHHISTWVGYGVAFSTQLGYVFHSQHLNERLFDLVQHWELETDIRRRELAFAKELGHPLTPLHPIVRELMETRWSRNHGLERFKPEPMFVALALLLTLVLFLLL